MCVGGGANGVTSVQICTAGISFFTCLVVVPVPMLSTFGSHHTSTFGLVLCFRAFLTDADAASAKRRKGVNGASVSTALPNASSTEALDVEPSLAATDLEYAEYNLDAFIATLPGAGCTH
jgi:hypothetical protein